MVILGTVRSMTQEYRLQSRGLRVSTLSSSPLDAVVMQLYMYTDEALTRLPKRGEL